GAGAGGATRVYSERGFGTTVRLAFPALEGRPALSPGELVAPPRRLPALGVLVVDDDDEVRAVAVRILRDAGCVVVDAATANEARRICVSHEGKLDLALVDLVLRDGRGDLLIDELRALRPGLTFLMTSGYPAGALEERGAASAEVVPKPFTPGELRVAAARACGVTGGDEPPFVPAAVRRLALVVDDDAPLRRTVVRVLRGAGFDCAEAADGAAAMTAVEDQRFDVVISDVNMPGGTGLDLLRAVRRVDLDVPIVLMTGEPSIGAAATAVQFGAFRYLTKPFDLDELARTAQEAARAHALARIRREAYAVTGMRAALTDRAGLEVRFQQAMERAWIAFQPIVYATSGAIHGVEALMRSVEPSLPTPDAVLAAAASLGRLPLLGRHLRGLAAAGMAGSAASHLLFVNLHPDDLMDAELVDPSSPLYAMAPRVVLEVTERAPLDVSAELHQRLDRLRSLGFRIAVDDVGAGYSGLSTFTELAPDLVKIDMSLVRDVHTNVLKQRTIAALCHLCHEGGTLVVGEGVETRDERDALIDLGCDLLQGHLLGYPSRDLPA
ncbi:MAG TPA: EAL domain-containing protein, partial [Kofleriaceae bacterium]|nr:EAL domain-containing protein [Kofleriaceae bacterium]